MTNNKCLRALALLSLLLTAGVAFADSTQDQISGKPGPYNGSCFSDCFKTFRSHGVLKTVILDSNGQVFKVLRTPLPESATRNTAVTVNQRRVPDAKRRSKADADYFQNFEYAINDRTDGGTRIGYGTKYYFTTIYNIPNATNTVTIVLTYTNCSSSKNRNGAFEGGALASVTAQTTTTPIPSGGTRGAS